MKIIKIKNLTFSVLLAFVMMFSLMFGLGIKNQVESSYALSNAYLTQPQDKTLQINEFYTVTWSVDFNVGHFDIYEFDNENSEWSKTYESLFDFIEAGTEISYQFYSDTAATKQYKITCYSYENEDVEPYNPVYTAISNEFTVTWREVVENLSGTVEITGTPKFGETLTAEVSDDNNTGTLLYQWQRNGFDIEGATEKTYTIVAEDIKKSIRVVVTSTIETGNIACNLSSQIQKADAPDAPNLTVTDCTTDDNNDGTISGLTTEMEYRFASDMNWTACTETTLTGLKNGTYFVRIKETNTTKSGKIANITINAFNTPTEFTITVINGTSNVEIAQVGDAISIIANAPETDYEFDKWVSSDVKFTNENDLETTFVMPAGNVTVTATYKTIKYTILFHANDGTESLTSTNVEKGSYILPISLFGAPTGKEFDGWSYSENGEKITTDTIEVTENIDLYALWKDVEVNPTEPEKPENPTEQNKTNNQAEKNGLSTGAIIAIVIVSVIVLGVGGFALVWFVIKKKTWADFTGLFKKK